MFDHNNENMEKSSLGPKDYRKKEIRLLKGFKIMLVLIILLEVTFSSIRYFTPPVYVGSTNGASFSIYSFCPMIIHGYLLFQYCLQHLKLRSLMVEKHNFEYHRTRKENLTLFILTIVSLVLINTFLIWF